MALYLKYRPKDFDSLVGQDFIKNTLKEAVKNNKLVGAYLFCGPRGTGKTSTARILAKAVNCKNLNNGNPCNNCQICDAINNESLVDVIEIDAASNTGVDNIREIINKAQFRPTNAKNKVYIIDEVHMLSSGAFNALLKILEEPPEYVKFILATTETHKVPETIISRCQRYDFKNISEKDLKERLVYIAKEEKIKIDDKSLYYIVKNSAGGLRNAISLFEQLIVGNEIKYDTLIENLGIINEDKLELFLQKLEAKDNSIIDDLEELIDSGKNIKLFFKELIFFTKHKIISELKSNKNITRKLEIIEILDETYSKTKNSLDENTSFFIGILKIINNNSTNNLSVSSNKLNEEKEDDKCIYGSFEEKKLTKKIENKNEIISESEIVNNENNLNINDVEDLFGEKNNDIKNIEDNIINNSNTGIIFDKKEFFNKLKDAGVKGMIISSLKQSDIFLKENILNITFKTQFVLKQFNTTENLEITKNILESMGYKDITIKLN